MRCGVQGIDDDPTFEAFNPRPVRGTQVNPLPAIGSSKFFAADRIVLPRLAIPVRTLTATSGDRSLRHPSQSDNGWDRREAQTLAPPSELPSHPDCVHIRVGQSDEHSLSTVLTPTQHGA